MLRTLLTILILYFLFTLFEMLDPAERGHTWRGRFRNVLFAIILTVTGVLFLVVIEPVIPPETPRLPNFGLGVSIFIIFLHLLLTDFIFYWYHRAQHQFRWLWPIHELHHSDTELNVTTSMRTYWLERPIQIMLIVLPVAYVVGADHLATQILPFLLTGWLFFTHANLKLNLGFATPLITGPQMHRIHHSILPQHQHKNYAQFFPFLDMIFGTYYRPAKNEYPPTGTPELASDEKVFTVIARPLHHWWRMLTSSPSPYSSETSPDSVRSHVRKVDSFEKGDRER